MFKNVMLLIIVLTIAGLVACERSPSQLKKDAQAESKAGHYSAAVRDYEKAAIEGAAQGDVDSEVTLAGIYLNGYAKEIPQDYFKAAEWYTKAAEQGNADAQYQLGKLYAQGRGDYGTQPNYIKAVEWYTKSAEQGNDEAQFNLGSLYAQGSGVPQDYAKALEWYTQAAQAGNSNAQFILGEVYAKGLWVPKDYAKAAEWYSEVLANASGWLGKSAAEVYLGNYYKNGQGVPQNFYKAVELYTKAAQKGHEAIICGPFHNCINTEEHFQGRNDLSDEEVNILKQSEAAETDADGYLTDIYYGRDIPKDYSIEIKKFLKSADDGNAQSQLIIGLYYENGWGVQKNYIEAYKWYALAKSAASDEENNSEIDDISTGYMLRLKGLMSPQQLSRAQHEASEWYELHQANPGNSAQEAVTQSETPSQVATKPTTQQIISDMNQYLKQVLGPNGHIDKSIHDQFWQHFQDAPRNEFDAGIKWVRGTLWVNQEFENELWKSALLSYKVQTVVKTKRLEQLENDMPTIVKRSVPWPSGSSEYTAAISGYNSQFSTSMEDANRLLNAAANHTTFVAVNGTEVELNEQVINQAAASVNASFKRLSELLNKQWNGN